MVSGVCASIRGSSKTSRGAVVGEGHPKTNKMQEKQRHWGLPMHGIF